MNEWHPVVAISCAYERWLSDSFSNSIKLGCLLHAEGFFCFKPILLAVCDVWFKCNKSLMQIFSFEEGSGTCKEIKSNFVEWRCGKFAFFIVEVFFSISRHWLNLHNTLGPNLNLTNKKKWWWGSPETCIYLFSVFQVKGRKSRKLSWLRSDTWFI